MNKLKMKPRLLKTEQHILKRIEMYSADGAANEQLAGRLLHPRVECSADVEKLPALKMVIRDKAHASRRLTQITFKVDAELSSICDLLLTDTASIAKMLRYSDACGEIFNKEVRRQTRPRGAASLQGHVQNLRFAKQRFDSTAKPLGRCIWNLDALVSTCLIIRETPGMRKLYT